VTSGRLEAFSDAVIAVLITIMVLELRPPEGDAFSDLKRLVPQLLIYLLSFVYLAIYWNNHHHLLQVVERINGAVLWANMHLLFWLSLFPFATAWIGEHGNARETAPVAVYGIVQLGAGIAYFILTRALLSVHSVDSQLAHALGRDWKGKLSVVGYMVGVAVSFVAPFVALGVYVAVAVVWLVPDRRIERVRPNEA
jgi:TMEM175 potassium channel family protein